LLINALTLSGCDKEPPKPEDLPGTKWELISLNGQAPIAGTVITLNFTEDYLGGEMGCNYYGDSPDLGKYLAAGDGSFSLVYPFAWTVQLCYEPAGIMEQEEVYLETLKNAERYKLTENCLELLNGAGETILIYRAR
jgi:heat shock protein HslJ